MENIYIAQLDVLVGNVEKSIRQVVKVLQKSHKASLVVFPELCIGGYPPRDLLMGADYQFRVREGLEKITAAYKKVENEKPLPPCVVGAPITIEDDAEVLINAAIFFLPDGSWRWQAKSVLPNYDVFFEKRYFTPAEGLKNFNTRHSSDAKPAFFKTKEGSPFVVFLCEDMWSEWNGEPPIVKQHFLKSAKQLFHCETSKTEEMELAERFDELIEERGFRTASAYNLFAKCSDKKPSSGKGAALFSLNTPVQTCLERSKDFQLAVNISASPFELGKKEERVAVALHTLMRFVFERNLRGYDPSFSLALVNQVGGNDELLFDGNSFLLSYEHNNAKKISLKIDNLIHLPIRMETLPAFKKFTGLVALRHSISNSREVIAKPTSLQNLKVSSGKAIGKQNLYIKKKMSERTVSFDMKDYFLKETRRESKNDEQKRLSKKKWHRTDSKRTSSKTKAKNSVASVNSHLHLDLASSISTLQAKEIMEALVMGIRSYAVKSGFKTAVVGLSGGIDSAVTACLAAIALGEKNVSLMAMPAAVSSLGSLQDAQSLANNLDIRLMQFPIHAVVQTVLSQWRERSEVKLSPLALENLQSRIRGMLLMAHSNSTGSLLLSTGNKSEVATGYCTLYGDTNGGLSVLGDCYKSDVFAIALAINTFYKTKRNKLIVKSNGLLPLNENLIEWAAIPEKTFFKAPSAELKSGQQDDDSLPAYDVLDAVLFELLQRGGTQEQLKERGLPIKIIREVTSLLKKSEYKRKQLPPVLRISFGAFGMGRMMPLAAKLWQ